MSGSDLTRPPRRIGSRSLGEFPLDVVRIDCERWAYRDVARLGRKTRIGGKQREVLWSIFERTRSELTAEGRVTPADVFGRVTEAIPSQPARPYAFAVVDEA